MSTTPKRRRYYAAQYGYVWSMTRESFVRFLIVGAAGGEWDLREFVKQLRGPGEFGEWPSMPLRRFVGVTVYPLDWKPENFADALKQFRKTGEVY